MHQAKKGAVGRLRVSALSSAISESLQAMSSAGRRLNQTGIRSTVFAASGGAILASALAVAPSGPVFAQEDQVVEEVTVTGSRIRRQDFTANAPVFSVEEELFDQTTAIGVETILNQLPQFVPAVTQFQTTDVQQTATNTVGASTVSLRGLGPNRNLVLINGRRMMPVNATMVIDTNSIPSAAIERVEVISGGASAVYGADAVGGVVNFILKDDFEGASVDVRFGDTDGGGNQEITISGLIGANVAGDRGNVMFGVERATRGDMFYYQRDWRVEDAANPRTSGFPLTDFFGSDPWVSNVWGDFANLPDQNAVNALFSQASPCAVVPGFFGPSSDCPTDPTTGAFLGVPNNTRLRVGPDGTIYTGLQQGSGAAGSYRFSGPLYDPASGVSGDREGNFQGLPVYVRQPDGRIKEINWWQQASNPLERLSAFANGHFEVADNVRVTAQAMLSRTETNTQLGLTADNVFFWGAAAPFGDALYRGNAEHGVPDSLNPDGTTNSAYLPGGAYGVNCEAAPSAQTPWSDGLPGCTNSEAWPSTPEVYNLFLTRVDNPQDPIWINYPPAYLRPALGGGRSSKNTLTTMNFSLGLEGELPSGNDFWDITVSTGRTDNYIIQRGSTQLNSYRALFEVPNFGRNAKFDPNPFVEGFAEGVPICTSGLPIFDDREITADCVNMITPDLKNQNVVTQTILEANIVGDLVEMRAGPLQYALGASYRENSFEFSPDNLSDNNNFVDPIAGLFPNEASKGEFDVTEIYGELLIPIVNDGPAGVEHFNVEIGGRISDWSMPLIDDLETYKALIDWGVTPRYRIRGGFNRAFRAPNLGELFLSRTQVVFGAGGTVFGDHCSQNMNSPASYSATAGGGASPAQIQQTLDICRALMGTAGALEFYDNRALTDQPTGGGLGTPNSFGNPNLQEEQADTFTLGVVMDFLDNWTLTVDYYEIEVTEMIALENSDTTYELCLSQEFNPTGDPTANSCPRIFRDPGDGDSATIDRSFTNEGAATVAGVDLQLNWNRELAGGNFNMNMVANYNLESTTQDRPDVEEIDHAGFSSCGLQLQCQQYDFRVFTTFNYFRGPWNVGLRHQYWPALDSGACRANPESIPCLYNSPPSFNLFALTGGYTFNDRYRLNIGIENLLDEEPPCLGANPENLPFATDCTRGGNGAIYDPLGRRYFVSMNVDF